MTTAPATPNEQPPVHTLRVQPITRRAFLPYGWLIDADDADDAPGASTRPINAGTSLRIDGLGELALDVDGGKPCLAVFRAQACNPAGPWQEMERHALGTQTFVPLGGVPYVMLVAPAGPQPEPGALAAFFVDGGQAVTLRAGTWHHGLLALQAGDFVVIERSAASVDCDIARLPQPVSLVMA
jgi:ureidoglycolate lyase